ncbi:MAG TPA: hypothetical protein DCY13_24985 [Verrucomicrobiales bacterium]|nr:hypothetical protein [Verrucomicrobiales bacterium]
MKTTVQPVLVCLGLGLLVSSALAVNRTVKPEDYAVISQRNPFGLVDPPPVIVPKEPEKKVEVEPPPNVELTGIFHNALKDKTYALFLVQEKGKAEKRSFMWSINEGDDGIKVVAIDQEEARVKLNVRGQESTITFAAPKQSPVAAGVPPVPNAPAPNRPTIQPNAQTGIQQFGTEARTGLRGGRSTVSAVGGALPVQTPGAAPGNSLQAIPMRSLRAAPQAPTQADAPQLSVREQEALIEINRAALQVTGQSQFFPPPPPTSLTTPQDLKMILVEPGQGGAPPVPTPNQFPPSLPQR